MSRTKRPNSIEEAYILGLHVGYAAAQERVRVAREDVERVRWDIERMAITMAGEARTWRRGGDLAPWRFPWLPKGAPGQTPPTSRRTARATGDKR